METILRYGESHMASSGGEYLLLVQGRIDLKDKFPKENAA
jgi:hypothetical protein